MPSEINFADSQTTYHYYSWQEIGDLTFKLYKKIKESEFKIDRIIALATGGLTMSRALRDHLGVKKLSNIQVEFYTDIGKKAKSPIITQSLPVNIDSENILIFDDINDSGGSLIAAKNYISLRGAKNIKTATLFQKPVTKLPSDFFCIDTECWVIFPDEIRESISALSRIWSEEGVANEEITQRLSDIGFSDSHIQEFHKS